jgi:hypothetical protein
MLYGWKGKYGGMEVGEAQRLKGLEDENRRLKTRVLRARMRLTKVLSEREANWRLGRGEEEAAAGRFGSRPLGDLGSRILGSDSSTCYCTR